MNTTLRPRRYWSGSGPVHDYDLSPDEFAALRADALRYAFWIIAVGGLMAYAWGWL